MCINVCVYMYVCIYMDIYTYMYVYKERSYFCLCMLWVCCCVCARIFKYVCRHMTIYAQIMCMKGVHMLNCVCYTCGTVVCVCVYICMYMSIYAGRLHFC